MSVARRAEAVSSAERTGVPPATKRISEIVPLDWVLAGNPEGKRDLQFGEVVEPKQWRLMKLVAPKKAGGTADVVMARPMTWLYAQWQASLAPPEDEDADLDVIAAAGDNKEQERGGLDDLDERIAAFDPQQLVGRTVYISVPECGIDGHAQVWAVEDCPNLKPRPGPEYQLVTATYRHHAQVVLDLTIEGSDSPVGTTANHPFWSEDRHDFVRADKLQPGERLRGQSGTFPRVVSSTPRPGTHDVYNLEVHLDHVYHIANNGVLVHNGDPEDCPIVSGMHTLDLTTSAWRKSQFGQTELVYFLRDATTGELLKVGQTTADKFIGRFEKYVTAGNRTGRNLAIDVFEVPVVPRGSLEGQIRRQFPAPQLPWDNTGRRLGRSGPGIQ